MKRFMDKRMVTIFKWSLIGGLAGDAVVLIGGYYYYRKLSHSSDFRYKIYQYDPRYVDLYYRLNERYGDGKARQNDYKEWGINKVEKFEYLHLFGL